MNIEKRVALLENRSHVNFAAVSNKAMGLEDGNVKIELSPAHNAIYFSAVFKGYTLNVSYFTIEHIEMNAFT